MAKLKLFVVLFAVVFQTEFIASINLGSYTLVGDKIDNTKGPPCTVIGRLILCNFSTPNGQKYNGIKLHSGSAVNLTIENAPQVEFDSSYSGTFQNIKFSHCKNIHEINKSHRNDTYRLHLENSIVTTITDSDISYLKAENSSIKELQLDNVDEFDIITSEIGTFYGKTTKAKRSTIIGSTVKSLNLTIGKQSWLHINDSEIDSIKELTIKNYLLIVNTTINKIPSKAATIDKLSTVTMENVNLGYLDSKSILVHGTLQLINVTYLKGYSLRWVELKPGASLTLTKFSQGNSSIMQSYTITNVSFDLNPFEVIEVQKSAWLATMLGVFLGMAVLCLVFLCFLKFSGKKLRVRKINVPASDKQEFAKLEMKDPGKDAPKNLYHIGNQEFPTSKTELPPDYVDIDDPENMVNYSEPDKCNPSSEDTSSDIKLTIDRKAPNDEMANKPPKLPAPLPSQKVLKPKPVVPKREFPPLNDMAIIPNRSFLQNINPRFIQAPPPPSKTGPVAIGNFQLPQMPAQTPTRKHSGVNDDPDDCQEEYDVCEDCDD